MEKPEMHLVNLVYNDLFPRTAKEKHTVQTLR